MQNPVNSIHPSNASRSVNNLKGKIFFWILQLLYGICVYCKGVDTMTILQQLWYGDLKPGEQKIISEQEKILLEQLSNKQENLQKVLSNEQLKLFNDYVSLYDQYASLTESQAFEIGFKISIMIMTE